MEPALNRKYRIFYLHHLMIYIDLVTGEESVDLDIVTLNRLLGFSFDPKYSIVVLSILADVIQHQLRFARSAKPPHHQDPHNFHPVIFEVVQPFLDLFVQHCGD